MRKLAFLFLFAALSVQAQTGIGMHYQGHAQAVAYSNWQANKAGDTLVAIIRPTAIAHVPCQDSPIGCGSTQYMVTDIVGNHWQPMCPVLQNVCVAWYALDAKPALNIVGVMASFGYDGGGEKSTGGYFNFDVIIAEYPPAVGVDGFSNTYSLNGDSEPHAPAITTTQSNDVLIFWTNNLAYNYTKGPLAFTPEFPFTVENDDGFLAMADRIAPEPGTYTAGGTYNGNCIWQAGVVALKMAAN